MSTTIKSIQDVMRKDVGVDGDAQRIGQLVWLLFLKIWDDRERELALLEDDFASPLVNVSWVESGEKRSAGDLRWSAWAADPEGVTGARLLDFVDHTLFPALKGMEVGPPPGGKNPKAKAVQALRRRRLLVKGVFEDAYQYMKSGTLLRQVVNKIQTDIDFNDTTGRHLFGDIYERILRDLQGAGNVGEYYTPRAVTQFAVDMIDPRLGESILDPACGTGGFLACAIEHVRRQDVKTPRQEAQLQASIRGVEKKPLPHLLCATNMIVHGIDVPAGIVHDNTLSRPLRDLTLRDRVDVVLTNPPFGGMEEDGIENNFPAEFRTRETADLFLVLIVELLKPGGRAAVVLPDGTLFGEGVKTRLKERLLTECDLHTIVRLPNGVFAPYTSIRTNVLFFEKGRPTSEVWYYEHPYPEGYKSYSKTKPMRIEEFAPEKAWWRDRAENECAWRGRHRPDPGARLQPGRLEPERAGAGPRRSRRTAGALREGTGRGGGPAGAASSGPRGSAGAQGMTPHDFIAHFDTIAEAPNGIARLREFVLQLAVRGKLVPQAADDEPAGSLLRQLKAGRKRLLAEGAIAKPRHPCGVRIAEEPFEIPPTWTWLRLGDVGAIVGGGTPKSGERSFWAAGDDVPWGVGLKLMHQAAR